MPFTILLGTETQQQRLEPFNQPGDKITLDLEPTEVIVQYDSIQGEGFSVATVTASSGTNTFEKIGGSIQLVPSTSDIQPASTMV